MKNDQCLLGKAEILHEILGYLVEHPDAQDTLDGIVEWWLLERKIEYRKTIVKEALRELVEKGFVLENKHQRANTRYLLDQGKMGEILSFLKKKTSTFQRI